MLSYLTPDRLRTMGLGVDLTDIEDVELRSVLARSSALVNDYTCAPILPQRHDFRGGTITDELHTMYGTGRRVYLNHRPLKAVTSMRLDITPELNVPFATGELYLNPAEGWVEVTAFALTSLGLAGVIAYENIGLQQNVMRVSYTYGYSFPVAGEFLETTDARTFRAVNGSWDSAIDPVIKLNGSTPVNEADYTVDYDDGAIIFDTAQSADDYFTADYTYTLPHEISAATAVIAESLLAERELSSRGMRGLESLTVEEIAMRRSVPQRTGSGLTEAIPSAARDLLAGYTFITVR